MSMIRARDPIVPGSTRPGQEIPRGILRPGS